MRQLCKGNVAVIKGAVLAGCRAYYGYPITPASEVAEAAAAERKLLCEKLAVEPGGARRRDLRLNCQV